MQTFLIIFNFILAALSAVFAVTYQFHMLQQNSYFPSRYLKWVSEQSFSRITAGGIILIINTLLYFTGLHAVQTVFLCVLCAYEISHAVKLQKKSIKPLVFTGRIKRLYGAAVIVILALAVAAILMGTSVIDTVITVIFYLLCFVPQALTLAVRYLTAPIETAFSNWYINDAKRILKNHHNLKVIGITGSYGKTTTKFILNRILSEKFNTVCTPQSFNTPMGVVRTVRSSIKPQTQIFICEMGAKKVGDIKEICDIVNPDCGIITSVGAQHLETFKSLKNVFKTKFELADSVKKNGGSTFINLGSEQIAKNANFDDSSLVPFGNGTDYHAENISYGRTGSTFDLVLKDERITVTTKLLGLHSVTDIVAAASVAHSMGVSAEDIRFAVASLKPTEHRLELKSFKNGSLLIDDAYNANPEGSLEAVRVLSSFEGMRKVIITPGLIELGDKEYDCNYALGVEAAKHCDIIILVGLNRSAPIKEGVLSAGFDPDKLYVVSSFAEAMGIYSPTADQNSVVLLENDLPDNYLN